MNVLLQARIRRKRLWAMLFATFWALPLTACSDSSDERERALSQLRADYVDKLDRGLTIDNEEKRRREIADVCGMLVPMFLTKSADDIDQLRFMDAEERINEVSFCIRVTMSRVEELSRDEHSRLAGECAGATDELSRILCDRAKFY